MIQSVARALNLLEELDLAGAGGLGLLELGERAGLKGPTAHHLIRTLVELGYAQQDSETRRYRLDGNAYALGRRGYLPSLLARVAAPAVEELRRHVDETVALAMYRDGKRHAILTLEGGQALRVGASFGESLPMYQTATGRMLLSQLSPDQLREYVEANGLPGKMWPEAKTKSRLTAALREFREAGVAYHRWTEHHIQAMAVPVSCSELDANVALGLSYPAVRADLDREKELAQALKDAAARICAEFERTEK